MSTMFICGKSGCDAIIVDDIALRRAGEQWKDWSRREYHKNGKYPSAKRQNEYFQQAYTRLTEIKVVE